MEAGAAGGAGLSSDAKLRSLYLADDRNAAMAALDRFCDLYATGQRPEFHAVVDTITSWADESFNYHDRRRLHNGRIEGTSKLLLILLRVAHGFTNTGNYAARGILVA